MNTATFNFEKIGSINDFYLMAQKVLNLPGYFGNNLDALWDSITGEVALPLHVRFTNMKLNQLEQFDSVISLFEEAADELGDDFSFEYFLKTPD